MQSGIFRPAPHPTSSHPTSSHPTSPPPASSPGLRRTLAIDHLNELKRIFTEKGLVEAFKYYNERTRFYLNNIHYEPQITYFLGDLFLDEGDAPNDSRDVLSEYCRTALDNERATAAPPPNL